MLFPPTKFGTRPPYSYYPQKPLAPKQSHEIRYGFIFLFVFSLGILLGSQVSLGTVRGSTRPSIQIWVHYRGAFAEEMERLITLPLENALGELTGLRELYSLSEREKCRLHLVFTENTCMDDAYLEVREVVDRVYHTFPPAVQRPVLTQSNPQDQPVFIAAFPLSLSLTEEELKQRFEQVEGVGEVEVGGRSREEVILQWLPEPGITKGISAWHLAQTVQSWNVRGGFTSDGSYPSRFVALKDVSQEFSELSLSSSLRLQDAGYVQTRLAIADSLARVNGKELLVVYVRPTGGAKLFSLSEKLQKVARKIPGSQVLYDSGHSLKASFFELFLCLFSSTVLLILFTFLLIQRLIPTLVLGLSIPFSLALSLSGLYLSQYPLNLDIVALLIDGTGLGMVKGLLIVYPLYRSTFLSLKISLEQAKGPLFVSTGMLISVFIPLGYVSSSLQSQLFPLLLALGIQQGGILIYLFVFLPHFLPTPLPICTLPGSTAKTSTLGSQWFGRCLDRCSESLEQWEENNPKFKYLPIPLAVYLVGASLLMAVGGVWLSTRFNWENLQSLDISIQDPIRFRFLVEFESGVPLKEVVERCTPLESSLIKHTAVKEVQVKYERERASFYLTLTKPSFTLSRTSNKARQELRSFLQHSEGSLSEGRVFFQDADQEGTPIVVTLLGPDVSTVQTTALDFAQYVTDQLPNSRDSSLVFHFKEALPYKTLLLHTEKGMQLGLNPSYLKDLGQLALSFPVVDKLIKEGTEIDLRLTANPNKSFDFPSFLSLPFPNLSGGVVQLKEVSQEYPKPGLERIYRTNRRRSASFSVFLAPTAKLTPPLRILSQIRQAAQIFPFPPGVTVNLETSNEENSMYIRESLLLFAFTFIITGLGILGYYGRAFQPLVILLQIPMFLFLPLAVLALLHLSLSLLTILNLFIVVGVGIQNTLFLFPAKPTLPNPKTLKIAQKLSLSLLCSLSIPVGVFPFFILFLLKDPASPINKDVLGLFLVIVTGLIGIVSSGASALVFVNSIRNRTRSRINNRKSN